MVRIECKSADMFHRIHTAIIAKISLIPKTWLPVTWIAEALKLIIILEEMANRRPSTKIA